MPNDKHASKPKHLSHARDHMANERTFLSWIRTSIGIMAFGFVVEKFSIFIKQIALLLHKENLPQEITASTSFKGTSAIFGMVLVAFGAWICVMAFIRFKKTERQIEESSYRPSILLDIMVTLTIFFIGIFLGFYLLNNA